MKGYTRSQDKLSSLCPVWVVGLTARPRAVVKIGEQGVQFVRTEERISSELPLQSCGG